MNSGGTTEGVHQQERNTNRASVASSVPRLYSPWLIINSVLKFMLEIIFVNMTNERKDMVKWTWI